MVGGLGTTKGALPASSLMHCAHSNLPVVTSLSSKFTLHITARYPSRDFHFLPHPVSHW